MRRVIVSLFGDRHTLRRQPRFRHTTDGSPSEQLDHALHEPVNISATTSVKYRAWDVAGNVEPINGSACSTDPYSGTQPARNLMLVTG
jgi:hypothetical protein